MFFQSKSYIIKAIATIIGAMTLTAFAQAQSLIRDAEIEEMLFDFSAPIIRAAGLTPENVDIYLVNDQSLNAFVTRGQNIFFHTGLINQSESPNQLKDQYAAQYLERTKQSSEGLIEFFEKFRYQEVLSQARRYPYFRGHPLSSDRIDNLREVTSESDYYGRVDDDASIYRLEMAKAKLRGFLDSPQIVFSQYPPEDVSDFALYARSVAYFRTADLKTAISEIDTLLERQPDNPYFHELKAQILFESGKARESIPSSEKALELKSDSALLETALARALTDSTQPEDLNRAVDLFKSALRREPNNGYAWYSLSQAYGRLNQEAFAKYAIAEQAYHTGDVLRARAFAKRAQVDLPRASPQWRRASDIIVIADSELAKSRGKRRRPKL